MIPTERFILCIVAGAVMIGAGGRLAALVPAGVAVIALAVVLALADWLRLTRGVSLEITRDCEDKLSLGAHNPVRISLRNSGYSALRGVVRDEYPDEFESDGNVAPFTMPPRSEHDWLYHVAPPKRGDYEFADTYVRLTGPFGLLMRQIKYPMRQHVKVYPNLLDMRQYEIGLKRQRPVQPGQRMIRMRGKGTDFESLRDYGPDDEPRTIDWKASARRGKLIVRDYQDEKSQNVLLALDCGRLMGPVIAGLTRLDHAINAAMMLAYVAAAKGDKVGLMAFAEEVTSYSPPKAGKAQTLNLLRLAYNLKDAEGDSNYHSAIPYLARKWTRRSLVVFFTDLIDPESSKPLISGISGLTRKHLCICVVMSDPAVIDAASATPAEPEDAFRAAAARQALQARKLAAAQLARAGAIVLDVPPDKFTPALVNEYLNIKARAQL
jgi:uncharacterized protein (DUF58 family)